MPKISKSFSLCLVLAMGFMANGVGAAPAAFAPVFSKPVQAADNSRLPPAPTVGITASLPRRAFPARPLPKSHAPAVMQEDPVADVGAPSQMLSAMPPLKKNFEGLNNIDGYYPPDTNGEVGKNYYVQMTNVSMAVYSKATGTKLYGPFHPSALWPASDPCGSGDDGDPVALYDQVANRWIVSQFRLPGFPNPPYYECIAVSKTAVPTNLPADWYAYTFAVPNNKMPDYPKPVVWPVAGNNAYVMSVNQFVNGSSWGGAGVYGFERAKMLRGEAARMVYFDVGAVDMDYGGMLPSDFEGKTLPPVGSPAFFAEVDDAAWIGPKDALRLWKFKVSWGTNPKATFGVNGQPNFVRNTAGFNLLPCVSTGSEECIPQQGTTQRLDSLGDRLMFRLSYRKFADHESLLLNHTVLAPNSADRAGIRWYEVQNAAGGTIFDNPVIHQQGTFAPNDGRYRWMGSIAMDKLGDIALGYSISGTDIYPGIRYVGRLAGDALGKLPQAEKLIIAGSGAQTGSAGRWGDYSDMTVDPVDDCTFWYTQEYIKTTGAVSWQTRIASFKFPGCM